nr:MAG TPA: hypothetical protein [Caudoviricetes sp.]
MQRTKRVGTQEYRTEQNNRREKSSHGGRGRG